jgi:hypothetical protein
VGRRTPRRTVAFAGVFLLGSIGVGLAVRDYRRRAHSDRDGAMDPRSPFALCTAHVDVPGLRVARKRWSPPLVAALALSLSSTDRARLEVALERANTRWEARANPMLEDLGDGDPDATLATWFDDATTTAATVLSLAADRFCGADGLCVLIVARGEKCPPGTAPPADAREDGRARFLAWPYGHAILVRRPTADGARALAHRLRERSAASSRLGVVLAGSDEDESKGEPFAKIRDLWIRHEALQALAARRARTEDDATGPLDAEDHNGEGGAAPDPSSLFPAHLDPRDVLVVPRLSAIFDATGLETEVEGG